MHTDRFKFQAIIFDFDGVLVESLDVKTQAFMQLYEHHGDQIVQQVRDYHLQNGGMSRYEKFKYFENVLLSSSPNEEHLSYLSQKFSDLVEKSVVAAPLVTGAIEVLESTFLHVSLFVASGTPEAELKRIIASKNLSKYFVSAHGAPARKTDIINLLVEQNGLDKSTVLMVGDATTDYDAAKKSNIEFVWRISSEEIIPPLDAVTIYDLSELMPLIFQETR